MLLTVYNKGLVSQAFIKQQTTNLSVSTLEHSNNQHNYEKKIVQPKIPSLWSSISLGKTAWCQIT